MQIQSMVKSSTIQGVKAIPVQVEVSISSGLPAFIIVGMPDAAIQEARERVKAAIRSCGFLMPSERVIVNLAPGAIRKIGSGFDLPIAVGILAATKQIPIERLKDTLFVGELSLEGNVRAITGILAHAMCARDQHYNLVCAEPHEGLIALRGLSQYRIDSLYDLKKQEFNQAKVFFDNTISSNLDYADVAGNEEAKRAFQVAAAGGHGILMMGPPGSGKTMLASRLPSILPSLTEEELLETALVHSVAGVDVKQILKGIRPFRSPHHSISTAGLVGGGSTPQPGEASLAHNGVLFLDELAEFKTSTLQSIRQPMESGLITIVRAESKAEFPARFMLVGASNPCPCGYYGDEKINCSCTPTQIKTYQNRIGGPLMDRIDIHIDVWRTPPGEVLHAGSGRSSAALKEGVLQACAFREQRNLNKTQGNKKGSTQVLEECILKNEELQFLEEVAGVFNLSGRGIMKILSVARTIADMDESRRVKTSHLSEALHLRIPEGVGFFG